MDNHVHSDSGSPIKKANPMKAWFPLIVILAAFAVAFTVFYTIFADPANFEGGTEEGHPINFFGIVYKGGAIIPVGISLLLITVTFFVERFITIFFLASGRSSADVFVQRIQIALEEGNVEEAIQMCDAQKGSIAAVTKAGLEKYREVETDTTMDKEQKRAAIQQAIEEATMLELPMLESNLVIIATCASIGVLVGLIGTVIGMIKAFQALGSGEGAPDAATLSVGISEALVNTALGITTSTLSIVFYNFFTTRIDGLTYRMDEAGYSIVSTFEAMHSR